MPFKWLPCCGSAKSESQGGAYTQVQQSDPSDQATSPSSQKSHQSIPLTPPSQSNDASVKIKTTPELRKASLQFSVNSTAEQLLLGKLPLDVIRCTRNVKLNVYGVPNSNVFGPVFYSHIIPQLEACCNQHNYDIEVLDISSEYSTATSIFFDKNWDYEKLVVCQPYKRGPFRYFNLIVLPSRSIEDAVLAPRFATNDFNRLLTSSISDEEKVLLTTNYVEDGEFMRLKSGLRTLSRRDVIFEINNLVTKNGSEAIREKYCNSTFENIVNYLFANATDVRENTCVLFLTNAESSTDEVDLNRVKALANKLRSQLPDSNFIELEEDVFTSSNGQSVSHVLKSILDSFCSQHDRTSYVPKSLPHVMHNELLSHNEYLSSLHPYSDLIDTVSFDSSKSVTRVQIQNNLQRRIHFASVVKDICSKDNVLCFYRFADLTSQTFTTDSLLLSLREQICYTNGVHPSNAYSSDIVQLLNALSDYASCDVYIAIDGLSDLSWLPKLEKIPSRIRFFFTSSYDVVESVHPATSIASVDNLESKVLSRNFANLFEEETTESFFTPEKVIQFFTTNFRELTETSLSLISNYPLSLSEDDLRHALSVDGKPSYSLKLSALFTLLSPFMAKIYSTFSAEYRLIPCDISEKYSQKTQLPILDSLTNSKPARLLQHIVALAKSGVSYGGNNLLQTSQFPNLLGLELSTDCSAVIQDGPLLGMAELVELVSPSLYLQYLSLQNKGDNIADFELLYDAVKSCAYGLSLSARVTYRSQVFEFFRKKFASNLKVEDFPFCGQVFKALENCVTVAHVLESKENQEDKFRPNKIKMINHLGCTGPKDFVIALLEHSQPSKGDPNGRIDVVRVSDLSVVRSIEMKGIPIEAKFIDLFSAVVNSERTLKVVNLDDGKLRVQLKGSLNVEFPVYGIQSEDQVVVLSRNRMYVNGIGISTNKQNFSFKVGEDRFLNSLMVNPNGAYVACGDAVQKPMPLLIWDLQQKILIHDIRIPDHEFDMSLAMAAEQYCAVVVKHIENEALNFVNVYEFATSYNKYNFHEDASVTGLAFTPKGTYIILGLADCSVVVHNLGSSKPPLYLRQLHRTPIDHIRYNLDATIFLTCSLKHTFADRTINLHSIEGVLLGTYTPDSPVSCIEIAPSGNAFFIGYDSTSGITRVSFADAGNSAESSNSDEAVYGNSELTGQKFKLKTGND